MNEVNSLNLKKLQNGSDIRGIALPGVPGEIPNLTLEAARRLTAGFLMWLSVKTGKDIGDLRIAVGHDPRLSADFLSEVLVVTISKMGGETLDCGLASTPAMFMSTLFPEYRCDGAIMITASHLPFNRNGFKYFDKDGGLNKKDITAIIGYGEELSSSESGDILVRPASGTVGSVNPCNLMDTYCGHLRDIIKNGVNAPKPFGCSAGLADNVPSYDRPLAGLKIVVDAGNGGGGFYADKVLAPLGADVSGSLFLEPDGSFPNHAPNPEDKKAMEAISRRVIETGADFGLIFDTDVDRAAAVDQSGNEISRNGIVALAAALIAEDHPGSTVVTDSVTSDGLSVFLTEKLGLKHLRYMRGYKNVINKAIELNENGIDSQLAIETSGHGAFKENYFLDDGAYLAAKIVIKAAKLAREKKPVSWIIEGLSQPREAIELRFPINCQDFQEYGNNILSEMKKHFNEYTGVTIAEPNYEGVRLCFNKDNGNGWCLLRLSLHDPIMPLNIESEEEGGCAVISEKLREFLSGFDKIDISVL